jgi:hypothetical protein
MSDAASTPAISFAIPGFSFWQAIEIDLKEMPDAEHVPGPLEPVDGVLY